MDSPLLPHLPAELWGRVLMVVSDVDDLMYLWTTCRQFCKTFKDEVEFIFREKQLSRTTIVFDPGELKAKNLQVSSNRLT